MNQSSKIYLATAVLVLAVIGLIMHQRKPSGGEAQFVSEPIAQAETPAIAEPIAEVKPNETEPAVSQTLSQSNIATNPVQASSPVVEEQSTEPQHAWRPSTNLISANGNSFSPSIDLVWIPPGTFLMGSPDNESGRRSNEGPQTEVTLTRGFWMGRYEVTIAQYQAFAPGLPGWMFQQMGADRRLDLPVTMIGWEDATNFCALLTERDLRAGQLPDGYSYRLPTEAEWEYACRAGTTDAFSCGNDPNRDLLLEYGWFGQNSSNILHPVGLKKPNPWGLYDMHGNAGEWSLDLIRKYPGGSVTDPIGFWDIPADSHGAPGQFHVLRAGGFQDTMANACRSAFRHPCLSSRAIVGAGFRVALAPEIVLPSNLARSASQ